MILPTTWKLFEYIWIIFRVFEEMLTPDMTQIYTAHPETIGAWQPTKGPWRGLC